MQYKVGRVILNFATKTNLFNSVKTSSGYLPSCIVISSSFITSSSTLNKMIPPPRLWRLTQCRPELQVYNKLMQNSVSLRGAVILAPEIVYIDTITCSQDFLSPNYILTVSNKLAIYTE